MYVPTGGKKCSVKLTFARDENTTSRTYSGINLLAIDDSDDSTIQTPNIDAVFTGFNLLFPTSGNITNATITKRELIETSEIQNN